MRKLFFYCTASFALIGSMTVQAQDKNIYQQNDTLKEFYQETLNDTKNIYDHKQVEVTEELLLNAKNQEPSFSVYRDNYFITGIPLNKKTSSSTADAMFQFSIRQRLTNSILPYNTFLYLTFTQKSVWNIYEESSPFKDNNYNPGIGIGKYLILNNKLKGAAFVQLEHESNGRDSIWSRSWNYISLTGKYFLNPLISMQMRLWIPYVDGEENKDLLDYRGLGVFSIDYLSRDKKWWFTSDVNPRKGAFNSNILLSVAYQLSKRRNQYAFVQFYNGYGQDLLDYNKFSSQLRVGFCIKPDFYSAY